MSAFDLIPLFLESPQGRIFVVHRVPRAENLRHGVVIIPPFAEEMNQSRRMVTLLVEALAEAGYHAMVFDLFGTGDSAGEFAEASWSGWLEQLTCCVESLRRDYGIERYSLVALRAGALLAADYLNNLDSSANRPERLLLWQPAIDGDLHLTQFLRLRVAADMLNGKRDRELVSAMRQQLEAGETVEVAGYGLTPAVSGGLSSASLKKLTPDHLPVTCWIDLVAGDGQVSPAVNRTLVEALQNGGAKIDYTTVVGRPFWNSVETVENHKLVSMTVAWLRGEADGR